MFIIVLGGGIDLKGNLPSLVYQRLDKAIEIYQSLTNSMRRQQVRQHQSDQLDKQSGGQNDEVKLVVAGRYSFLYHQLKKFPPTTEAEKMAQYLLEKQIPKNKILLEKKSKDTIGNAYYLKKDILIPHRETRAIIITSNFHRERVKYIFDKIFGLKYHLQFVGVEEKLSSDKKKQVNNRQKELLAKTKQILSPMANGDHNFLKGKLYKIRYYKEKRPDWVINFVAQGK